MNFTLAIATDGYLYEGVNTTLAVATSGYLTEEETTTPVIVSGGGRMREPMEYPVSNRNKKDEEELVLILKLFILCRANALRN